MATSSGTVAIVGAGHGGATAAALLRQRGHTDRIVVVDRAPHAPYERPPLSKGLLESPLGTPLFPADFYDEHRIERRLGTSVEAIDAARRRICLDGGEAIAYDALILASGATARRLPLAGHDLEGVHQLRTLDDAVKLASSLRSHALVVILGGGWIGLEVASSARRGGHDVTVIEREARLLARVASTSLSSLIMECHLRHGVEVLTEADVRGFDGVAGHVVSVTLTDRRRIPCDCVVVGVGAAPDLSLAEGCGLACADGVLVDGCSRTSDPAIYAIGDVARRMASPVRLESIPNATEQARQAVAGILGLPPPGSGVPWFYSDQFEMKLQIAGLIPATNPTVVQRDHGDGRVSLMHVQAGRLVAVEAISSPGEFAAARRLIRDRAVLDVERLADPSLTLASIDTGAAAGTV